MSFPLADSFDQQGGDSPAGSSRPFDDGHSGEYPRLPPQRFESFSNFADTESVQESGSPVFISETAPEIPSPPPTYGSGGGFGSDPSEFSDGANGEPFVGGDYAVNGPILPAPSEMLRQEGYGLREWRRENAIRLEQKEKRQKELLTQIIDEADEYKVEFYKKRQITCESNKFTNREREKVFLAGQENFHAEADKNYWKSIADFIPNEVPTIEKKGKKEQEKKPSIVVVQGPKPGKPTDLSRLRQTLLKLKHNTPSHLKHSPADAAETAKDTKSESAAATAAVSKPAAVTITQEAVAVA